MAVYTYQALRSNGEKVSGHVQAQSRTEAYRKLDEQNLQPVSMVAGGEGAASKSAAAEAPQGPIHLSRTQIITFTEELSDLLDAGLQLETALRIMEERNELSVIKQVVAALRQKVRDGVNFSVALKSVSNSFGDLYCNLVAAGELSGALPQLLRRQTSYLIAVGELQSRVVQALVYPAFIFGSGALLLVVFMTVLLPRLVELLAKTQSTLPAATLVLIAVSNFFANYWWALLAAAAIIVTGFLKYTSGAAGRVWWDKTKLRLPLVGPVILSRLYAQFSHTMANLLANGVSMLASLRLTHKAAGNTHFQALLSKAIDLVAEGGALSQALKRVGGFPPLMIDMLVVGEQTGNADTAFEKIGTRYEKELAKRIQRLTELIQPTVIIIMALVVGLVAYSIIAGIFQSMSGLRVYKH